MTRRAWYRLVLAVALALATLATYAALSRGLRERQMAVQQLRQAPDSITPPVWRTMAEDEVADFRRGRQLVAIVGALATAGMLLAAYRARQRASSPAAPGNGASGGTAP